MGELVLANLVAFPAFYLSTQALWKVECLEEATCVQHKIDEVLNLDVGYKKAGSHFVAVVPSRTLLISGFLSSGRTLELPRLPDSGGHRLGGDFCMSLLDASWSVLARSDLLMIVVDGLEYQQTFSADVGLQKLKSPMIHLYC